MTLSCLTHVIKHWTSNSSSWVDSLPFSLKCKKENKWCRHMKTTVNVKGSNVSSCNGWIKSPAWSAVQQWHTLPSWVGVAFTLLHWLKLEMWTPSRKILAFLFFVFLNISYRYTVNKRWKGRLPWLWCSFSQCLHSCCLYITVDFCVMVFKIQNFTAISTRLIGISLTELKQKQKRKKIVKPRAHTAPDTLNKV